MGRFSNKTSRPGGRLAFQTSISYILVIFLSNSIGPVDFGPLIHRSVRISIRAAMVSLSQMNARIFLKVLAVMLVVLLVLAFIFFRSAQPKAPAIEQPTGPTHEQVMQSLMAPAAKASAPATPEQKAAVNSLNAPAATTTSRSNASENSDQPSPPEQSALDSLSAKK